jgi:anti-sigma-K factor RskA/F0F1-type ATP synthase membrane subunit b/b'
VDHEQLEEHLSLYALGTLEPDSANEVESHLASGCPNCNALLRQYQGAAGLLPYALTVTTPSTELKTKIMRAITGPSTQIVAPEDAPAPAATLILPPTQPEAPPAKTSIPPPPPEKAQPRAAAKMEWEPPTISLRTASRRDRPAGPSLALAASFAGLLLGLGGYAYYLYATVEDERAANVADRMALAKANLKVSDLERLLDERQRNLSKATSDLNRAVQALGTTHELLAKHQEQIETLQAARLGKPAEDIARIFSSPYARMATLNGTGMAKDAYAMVFMEPDTRRGFFYANNLPALPAGKTYQLWIITDTPRPVSAGVFSLDRGRKGRGMLQNIPDVAKIKQFAVSLEPAGGKPQPTGAVYLAGDL